MTRPAWLDVVAEICGGEPEDWRPVNAHGITWRWRDEDSTERTWSADGASIWHEGGGLWVEVRCYGEPDHAQLARAVRAGLAVARGDLDVAALQQQVATLTRERDGLAAERATLHTFLTAAAEPESYPDDPRLFALSAEQERLITAYAARWRAECKAADKERAEIAAGPDWREIHALRAFASRVQAAHATSGCEREPVRLSSLPLLADRVVSAADRLAGALETIERIASAAGCPDVEPADLPARVAALAGPVGSLVPDAPGLWWLDMGGWVEPVRVRSEHGRGLVYGDAFGCWLVSSELATRWLGPVAPPRGAR